MLVFSLDDYLLQYIFDFCYVPYSKESGMNAYSANA